MPTSLPSIRQLFPEYISGSTEQPTPASDNHPSSSRSIPRPNSAPPTSPIGEPNTSSSPFTLHDTMPSAISQHLPLPLNDISHRDDPVWGQYASSSTAPAQQRSTRQHHSSFHILKPDRGSSAGTLKHVVNTRSSVHISDNFSSGAPQPHGDPEDIGAEGGPGAGSSKRHTCPTCFKTFDRPSALRLHVNIHTGATPFQCPWPGCGKSFSVNSNMLRHYRNHTPTSMGGSPSASSSSRQYGPSENRDVRHTSPFTPSQSWYPPSS